MDQNTIDYIPLIASVVNASIVAITACILLYQVRLNHKWNRRKKTHEVLDMLVSGRFPAARREIELLAKVDFIHNKNTEYCTCIANVEDCQKEELERCLVSILNIFETVAINIKNDIIDENICYDYSGFIYTEFFRFSDSYVKQRRENSEEPGLWINFTNYAKRWRKRIEGGKNKSGKGAIRGLLSRLWGHG